MSQFQENGKTDGGTKVWTLIHRTYPATTGGQKYIAGVKNKK